MLSFYRMFCAPNHMRLIWCTGLLGFPGIIPIWEGESLYMQHREILRHWQNSTQFWYSLPADSTRLHRLKFQPCKTALLTPNPHPSSKARLQTSGPYLPFWLTGYSSGVPMTSSLCLTYLLEHLIESRETLTFIILLKYMIKRKRINSQMKRYGKVLNKRASDVMKFGAPLLAPGSILDSTSTEALWKRTRKLFSWVFMETSLYTHDWLSQWSLPINWTSSPPFLPRDQEVALKILTL